MLESQNLESRMWESRVLERCVSFAVHWRLRIKGLWYCSNGFSSMFCLTLALILPPPPVV